MKRNILKYTPKCSHKSQAKKQTIKINLTWILCVRHPAWIPTLQAKLVYETPSNIRKYDNVEGEQTSTNRCLHVVEK